MSYLNKVNAIVKHVWTEPKFVAEVEYMRDYPSPIQQMLEQVGRDAAMQYVNGDGWPEDVAKQRVEVVLYERPDFDWWEPRHDQPWRRKAMRDAARRAEERREESG